jgi:rhodanese-related sulfurtransferase
VRALHTPGHRPEHTAFALIDRDRGAEPWAVLTGDSLFVGDIARPDLAVEKAEGARGIFHSLHDQLLPLGDDVEVWPGHLGGSLCGGPGMDMKVSSTVGYERRNNELLAVTDQDDFVARTTSGLRPQPPNFQNIVALNRGPLRREPIDAHPLTPRQIAPSALVIDVRTALQFDEAHIPGAVSNTILHAGFGTRLAWIASPEDEIVLVGRDDADALHAAELAAAVGLASIAGYLAGGMTSWREERLRTERIERITVPELHARARELQILDVRERDEWDAGHIPDSHFAPYHDIHELPDGLDPERPVAVICASGQRAVVGASLLQRHGARRVLHVVDGGVPSWVRNGWPVVR